MRQLAHPRSQLVYRDQAVLHRHLGQPRPFLVLRQMLDGEFTEQRPQVGLDRVEAQVHCVEAQAELVGDASGIAGCIYPTTVTRCSVSHR
jgi:hypothetical protein